MMDQLLPLLYNVVRSIVDAAALGYFAVLALKLMIVVFDVLCENSCSRNQHYLKLRTSFEEIENEERSSLLPNNVT